MLAPAWGRLGDRFGRKIMVERSLVSFVVLFAAMAFVTSAWQVLAIRAMQGLFAGYGSLSVAMAAESAPRDRMPSAIGAVQTAQRIGPGVGPLIGGVLARSGRAAPRVSRDGGVLRRRPGPRARDVRRTRHRTRSRADAGARRGRVTFRNVLAFQNFILMMVRDLRVAVRRSQLRPGAAAVRRAGWAIAHAQRARWSPACCSRSWRSPARSAITSAAGCCGGFRCRVVIAGGAASRRPAAGDVRRHRATVWMMCVASTLLGLGIGAAMTASLQRRRQRDSAGRARRRIRRADQRVAGRHGEQPVHRRVSRRQLDPRRVSRRPRRDGRRCAAVACRS